MKIELMKVFTTVEIVTITLSIPINGAQGNKTFNGRNLRLLAIS
jgi:hypothetical protein